MVACAQVSAIGPVTIFSGPLLKKIKENDSVEFDLSIKEGVLVILVMGALLAILSAVPLRYAGRKLILSVFSFTISFTHGMIALCYNKE